MCNTDSAAGVQLPPEELWMSVKVSGRTSMKLQTIPKGLVEEAAAEAIRGQLTRAAQIGKQEAIQSARALHYGVMRRADQHGNDRRRAGRREAGLRVKRLSETLP